MTRPLKSPSWWLKIVQRALRFSMKVRPVLSIVMPAAGVRMRPAVVVALFNRNTVPVQLTGLLGDIHVEGYQYLFRFSELLRRFALACHAWQ